MAQFYLTQPEVLKSKHLAPGQANIAAEPNSRLAQLQSLANYGNEPGSLHNSDLYEKAATSQQQNVPSEIFAQTLSKNADGSLAVMDEALFDFERKQMRQKDRGRLANVFSQWLDHSREQK